MRSLTITAILFLLLASPAMAQQYVLPESGATGRWDDGGCADLDDGVGLGDATYATEDDGSALTCHTSWSGTTPDTGTHTLRCRLRITSGTDVCSFTSLLCDESNCSGTARATLNVSFLSETWSTWGTTTVDVSGIDYDNLYIRVIAECDGTRDIELADCELETPDPAATGRTRRVF